MQVPSWLNLDAIVPPDLIAEADALVPESLALADAVTRLAARVLELQLRFEDAYEAGGAYRLDDFAQFLDTLTGWEDVAAPWTVIEAASETIAGGGVEPGYYTKVAESMGLPVVLRPEPTPQIP